MRRQGPPPPAVASVSSSAERPCARPTGGDGREPRQRAVEQHEAVDRDYSRLVVLAVSPQERGHGVGGRLVEAIERWSATNGADQMFVNGGSHRSEAHHFYEEEWVQPHWSPFREAAGQWKGARRQLADGT